MASFGHLNGLRQQNKELLQILKDRTGNLQRLRSGKQLEHQSPESVPDARKSINRSDRKSLTERNESLLNVSDNFINLTVNGKRPKDARSALCKPINTMKPPTLPGKKPETELI